MLKNQKIIDQMTLEQKASMMSGKNTWETRDIESLQIPSIFLSDGPHGLRKQAGAADHLGLNESVKATCFPPAATVANSWDPEIGKELGKRIGEEAAFQKVHMVLGPGLNIKRSPLCGRNFEYFSEDPLLAGKMAAGYIQGIQSAGVAACPKHFAVNSQELRRMSSDSILDDRTFRELYLTGFEIAVKEGKAKSIMSSYNRINGVYANENAYLLQKILVDEWGFDGVVVSDWGASNDHGLGVQNGSHLEMPSTGDPGKKELIKDVKEGRLSVETLDQRVDELLDMILKLDANLKEKTSQVDFEEHHQFAIRAARESIVLLKNEGNILPLKGDKKVAIIGDFAEKPRYQGAGSSLVNPTRVDNTLEALKSTELVQVGYAKGFERNQSKNPHLLKEAIELAKTAEYVLLYVGLDEISESEGMDRDHMKMPENQIELIQAVSEVNQNTVVVLSAGSVVEMPWIQNVKAVIHGYLGGQAGANAMLDVITGEYAPSGRLNETYPLVYEDSPVHAYFPGKEYTAEYREGIFVGYRYFDTTKKEVLFPFGFGLSYTEFEYTDLFVTQNQVSFKVRNVGTADAYEICQMYIGKTDSKCYRPEKELKGFKKVWVPAGETLEVTIPFEETTFRLYDSNKDQWIIESGAYQVHVGKNVQDICLVKEILLDETVYDLTSQELLDDERTSLPSYYNGNITDVTDEEFSKLLGHKIPDGAWKKDQPLDMNDTFAQLFYAKGWIGRLVYWVLTRIKVNSEKKGVPNLNILFIYNMPFRGLAKMTEGAVTYSMAEAILMIFNGHACRGIGRLIKAAVRK